MGVHKRVGEGSSLPRSAYAVLLVATFVGNLAGAMVSAPINEVAADLRARPSAVVLVLSVFMIAMMLASPAAGRLTQRIGPRWALAAAMAVMAGAQVAAAWSPSLAFLVVMRAIQGAACAVLPPAVQTTLVRHWPDRSARSMAAWASAAAVGQAAGLPLGGLVADLVEWRGVFLAQALLSFAVVVGVLLWAPREGGDRTAQAGRPSGLVVAIGLPVVGLTWAAQRGPWLGWLPLVVVGAAVGAAPWLRRSGARRPRQDRAFLDGTAAAAASMFTMGTVLAGVTLRLGQEFGCTPSEIGVVAVCFSVAMSVGSPLSARAVARYGSGRVLGGALGLVAAAASGLAMVGTLGTGTAVLSVTVLLLLVIGGGVGGLQSNAAHQVMSSEASSDGAAHGLHNMVRFGAISCGYAWVAFAYPLGHSGLSFAGAAAVVVVTLAVVGGRQPRSATAGSTPVHRCRIQVRWSDLDRLRHVNNVVYGDYLREARLDFLEKVLPASAEGWFARDVEVVRHQLRYLAAVDEPLADVGVEIVVVGVSAGGFALEYVVHDPARPEHVFLRARTDLAPVEDGRTLTASEQAALRGRMVAESLVPGTPLSPQSASRTAALSVAIRASDLDVFGRLGSDRALELAQEARFALHHDLASAHPGIRDGIVLVVAETTIEHVAPLRALTRSVEICSGVTHVGRSSLVVESALVDEGRVVARARVVSVAVDADRHLPVALPPRFRDVLLAPASVAGGTLSP